MDLQTLKRPGLEKLVNFRMEPAELEEVKATAAKLNCSVSEYLRWTAREGMKVVAAAQATPADK